MLGGTAIEVGSKLDQMGLGFVGMPAAEGCLETDLANEGETVTLAAFHAADEGLACRRKEFGRG